MSDGRKRKQPAVLLFELFGLPGRAGLDAGFGISYNSLVWTKDPATNTVVFNADNSNLTPGFRFGFPTIEPVYYDATTEKFAYLMVTPSGGRAEFRQSTNSNIFETADSSYAELKINGTSGPERSGGSAHADRHRNRRHARRLRMEERRLSLPEDH
ncbi:MAG: hypothetical protein IPJ30_05325 [Acidobacteria bacterium]|nr:hypothetical protein [Acidobacteriota bacterium]